MNAKVPRVDSRERCHAYGLALDTQNRILDQMKEMVENMRAIGKSGLLPFQKGNVQLHYTFRYLGFI